MIVDLINRYLTEEGKTFDEAVQWEMQRLAGVMFRRQFIDEREDKPGVLRLSSVGRCARQQAYAFHGIPKNGKEMDSRSKLVFWAGDLTELTVVMLAQLAVKKYGGGFITAVGMNQVSVKFILEDDKIIEGHPDGIFFNQTEKQFYTVSVKSMNRWGYDDFEDGKIDESYIWQENAYMETLGISKTVFIAQNKDTGVMGERVFSRDENVVADIRSKLKVILASTPDSLPERPFFPNDKGFYPWNCLYCSFWKTCHPNAKQVLVGKSYKLKEKK